MENFNNYYLDRYLQSHQRDVIPDWMASRFYQKTSKVS